MNADQRKKLERILLGIEDDAVDGQTIPLSEAIQEWMGRIRKWMAEIPKDDPKPAATGPIEVWVVAIDSVKNGTTGIAATSEADAYHKLLAALKFDQNKPCLMALHGGEFPKLETMLQQSIAKDISWEVSKHTIKYEPKRKTVSPPVTPAAPAPAKKPEPVPQPERKSSSQPDW